MIDGQFDIVFRGQTIKFMDIEDVKSNLVVLFKSSPAAVEKLFIGSEVAIKKSLDYATAMKYQSALKKAGALALIKEVVQPDAAVQTNQSSQGKAVFGAVESDNTENREAETSSETVSPASDSQQNDNNLAKQAEQAIETSIDSKADMTLADAGAQIMPDKIYEKRNVDTSDLSLAAAGERIMPKSAPENVAPPSIDHLSLE